jgi:hypothetical protein
MSDAKQRKDIMDELLSDSKAHGYIRQKELDELLDLMQNPFLPSPSLYEYSIELEPVIKKTRVKEKSSKTKRKTTHYLTEENFKDLGLAKNVIRNRVPEQYRSRISKTRIVNQALEMILHEFELQGVNSKLMQIILQNIGSK